MAILIGCYVNVSNQDKGELVGAKPTPTIRLAIGYDFGLGDAVGECVVVSISRLTDTLIGDALGEKLDEIGHVNEELATVYALAVED